jgi:hypothetical protein
MATSGSSDWSQTRDDIIQQVLEITNMIGVGATPSASLVSMVSTHLNQYVKHLQATHQVKLWKLEWATKTFSAASEVTATDSTIWTCIRNHTSSSDNEPVTGANHTTYWKLSGSTGGSWADSTAYTSTGDFTDSTDLIGIETAFLRKEGTDRPITIIGHREYMAIADKHTSGSPTDIYYDNRVSPTVYVYPQLDDTSDVIHYQRILRIEDFDAAGNDPDFPVHWLLPIVWNVASIVGVIGEVSVILQGKIDILARKYMTETLKSAQESAGDLEISPDLQGYY